MDEHHRHNSLDYSSALAQKLLQGWALLDQHCPQCFTPLMRNRQRRLYCVACEQWVIREGEAADGAPQQRDDKQAKREPALPSRPSDAIEENCTPSLSMRTKFTSSDSLKGTDMEMPTDRNDQDAAGRLSALTNTTYAHRGTTTDAFRGITRCLQDGCQMKPSDIVLPKVDVHHKMDLVLSSTLLVLVQKLEETRCVLATSQNIHDIRQLLLVLGEILQAIGHLKNLGVRMS